MPPYGILAVFDNFFIFFKKTIDKRQKVWYNIITAGEGEKQRAKRIRNERAQYGGIRNAYSVYRAHGINGKCAVCREKRRTLFLVCENSKTAEQQDSGNTDSYSIDNSERTDTNVLA